MPSDGFLKFMNAAHKGLLKISGGRVGWTGAGMPVIQLTTTGRKSGQPRSVMLTVPTTHEGHDVIVASRGGDDVHPAWFLNLRDQPEVTVTKRGRAEQMRARVATADERAELWPRITAKFKNYAGYQEKTDREIPLVVLEPPS